MRPWQAGAAIAGAYLLFLMMTAPAAKLLPVIQSQFPAASLAGVSGSLWSGEAIQVRVGDVVVNQARWDVRLLSLFKGALELDINGRLNEENISTRVGRSLFGHPYLRDLQGRVAAAELLRWLKINAVGVDGQLEFVLDSVVWQAANAVPAISGTATWMPALLNQPVALNLGSVRLDATAEDAATSGRLTASGGALTADGLLTLQADGRYELRADLDKAGVVPAAVEQFLTTFTEVKDGRYHFEWSDQLPL